MAGRMLVETTRKWPHSLVLLTDPASSEDVPTRFGSNGVAAGQTVLATAILHAVDVDACAQVWVGTVPGDLICVFQGEFETSSGAVIVSDTADELHAPADVGAGVHRLRVLVDEEAFPTRVVFELER